MVLKVSQAKLYHIPAEEKRQKFSFKKIFIQYKFKSLKFWEFLVFKNFVLANDKHFSLKMKIWKFENFFETKCFVASLLPEYDIISLGKHLKPYPNQI